MVVDWNSGGERSDTVHTVFHIKVKYVTMALKDHGSSLGFYSAPFQAVFSVANLVISFIGHRQVFTSILINLPSSPLFGNLTYLHTFIVSYPVPSCAYRLYTCRVYAWHTQYMLAPLTVKIFIKWVGMFEIMSMDDELFPCLVFLRTWVQWREH